MEPLNLRTLILTLTLLAATLSGCISVKDDAAPEPTATHDEPDMAPEPTGLRIQPLHSVTWAAQRVLDERFTVPPGYDHIHTSFWNAGQLVGHPVLEDGDGQGLDDSLASITGGSFHLTRLMAATPGEASLTLQAAPRLSGVAQGAGGFDAIAVGGLVPVHLLHLSHAGQRAEPVVLETQVHFYVPDDVERFLFAVDGSGQTTFGFRLLDPDGETMSTHDRHLGTLSANRELDAKSGYWTLLLEGTTSGSWTISATTLTPTPMPLDDATPDGVPTSGPSAER